MKHATVRAKLIIDKPNKQGKCPVKIIITISGQRTYQSTGIRVLPKDWDDDFCTIRKTVANYHYLNQKIKTKVEQIEAEILKKDLAGESISVSSFKEKRSAEVAAYMLQIVNDKQGKYTYGRLQHYMTEANRLNEFRPGTTFDQIDVRWLSQFEKYLREKNLQNNTLTKVWKVLKSTFNKAIKDGTTIKYPFHQYDNPKYIQTERTFLLAEEVQAIEDLLKQPLHESLENTICYFLLGCYSGLRFSDWQRFNFEGFVKGDRIILRTKKNGEIVSLQMHKKLKAAVERLRDMPPVLSEGKTNENLKAIAKLIKTKKRITSHVARHSFAVRCAELDIPPSVTAELMGITLKVVMIYYRLTNRKIDAEFAKWDKA